MVNFVLDGELHKNVIVVGAKENMLAELNWVTKQLRLKSSDLLQAAIQSLCPKQDSGDSTEFWYEAQNVGNVKVSICVLPTCVSRHSIQARPHAICDFVKKYAGSEKTNVLLVLKDASDAFAAGCAVARAVHLYSRKNGGEALSCSSAAEDKVTVMFSRVNKEELSKLSSTANAIQLACALVDAPPNELHTDAFVEQAKAVANKVQAKIQVIRGEALNEGGFGGIYGVGKAALHPPSMVILSHVPQDEKDQGSIVLVGKGIVFDTGGLSIKMKDVMPGMKRDMGGAAAILGAFQAAVESNICNKPLYAILCLAENAVSEVATRPDDVHIMYSGKSVEVNNTDAEGRLVLGDGVAYAVKHLNPTVIIDMATLTGAQGISTGRYFGSLYCNNEELENVAIQAGRSSGDLVHPLPYAPEFFRPEFKSAVADMKNSVKDRANAQVSCAGQFIANHLGIFETQGKWLHIDMAYPSFCKSDERATGFGVALLQDILERL